MSQPRTSAAHRDLDPWNGLFYTVADRLTPLFKGEGRGKVYARYAAGEAIIGYHPDSRADYATIGRILALSLATITAAEHASRQDLPTDDLVRVLGKVHTLSQAADRAERTMMTRRRQMQEDGVHRDALVPRPSGRPSRYAPLPADDPASAAAREAEEAQEAEKTVAEPHQPATEPQPAPAAALGEPPAANDAAHAPQPAVQPAPTSTRTEQPATPTGREPEAPPLAPAKARGPRMPETVPAALRAAFQSGHPSAAMAMVPARPGFPVMSLEENTAFGTAAAGPSFRQHLLGSGAIPAADRSSEAFKPLAGG